MKGVKRLAAWVELVMGIGIVSTFFYGCSGDNNESPEYLGSGWWKYEVKFGYCEAEWHTVFCLDKNNVWAGGILIDDSHGTTIHTAIVHWDGYGWNISIDTVMEGEETISSLFFLAPDNGWALGIHGKLLHYDGQTWSVVDSFKGYGWGNKVFFLSENDGWIVFSDAVFHYDGSCWSLVNTSDVPGGNDIDFSSENDGWITGSCLYHWDGSTWSMVDTVHGGSAVDAWDSNDVWIGADYLTSHWDGQSWSYYGVPVWVNDVFRVTSDRVLLCGFTSLHSFNGSRWIEVFDGGGTINSIHFVDSSYGWAAGWNYLYNYDYGNEPQALIRRF